MRAAVIGAGIQGIGVALELAARGVPVDLHEKTDRVHGRASLANEGKIHLGYIYANDPTLRTARQMVEGAWSFSPIVGEWLGHELDEPYRSRPFHYLVHRESLLARPELEAIYGSIAALNQEEAGRPGASYFGLDGARAPRRIPAAERQRLYGKDVAAAYETPEIAVDTEAIGAALGRRVADDPSITLMLGSEVLSVRPDARGVSLTSRYGGSSETKRYDHVINASWEDLLRIDATAGITAPAGSSFRWRHVVRIREPLGLTGLGSSSIVLGAFGDLVRYSGGGLFLSWYPVGRRGIVNALRPPLDWSDGPQPADAEDVLTRTLSALSEVVPELGRLDESSVASATVHAGVVYARGTSDIDDPASGYHQRHAIGPRSFGHYHTVDTGKYTTAPLFARRLAERIAGPRH
jgi:hypothetical protein